MGWLDRTKAALGLGKSAPRHDDGRPPLKDHPAASSEASLDDALAARAEGRVEEARAIFRAIDRGKGLRTVLRAGAALEARDEEELAPLARAIAANELGWRLALQTASALDTAVDTERVAHDRLITFAEVHHAPKWALAWANPSRQAKVEFLFADAPLARTVAAREWKVEGAQEDRSAIERYAGFAHGRDLIRRFGALAIAAVVGRAFGVSDPGAP